MRLSSISQHSIHFGFINLNVNSDIFCHSEAKRRLEQLKKTKWPFSDEENDQVPLKYTDKIYLS